MKKEFIVNMFLIVDIHPKTAKKFIIFNFNIRNEFFSNLFNFFCFV